jgi:hypothetical protein
LVISPAQHARPHTHKTARAHNTRE